MGNPYTSQSISGYNSSPPPDDGSTGSDNEITWAKHKSKLADPVKTLAEGVNSAVSTAFGKIFGNNITTAATAYTVQTSDQGKFISCSGTFTVTLLAAATAGTNFCFGVLNNGSGTITLDGNGSETINGSTTVTLGPGQGAVLATDASNWFALGLGVALTGASNTFTADQVITSTDAGADLGPALTLYRNSASPAASDLLGETKFDGEDSGGAQTTYAKIFGKILDATDTSEDGQLVVNVIVAGTERTPLKVGAGIIVPDSSGDPTGGDKGQGTVNAKGLYRDGEITGATLLETESASASASLDFTDLDATRYQDYLMVVSNIAPSSDGANLWIRVSTDGGSNYKSGASDYTQASFNRDTAGSQGANDSTGQAQIVLTQGGVGAVGNEKCSGWVRFHSPGAGGKVIVTWHLGYFGTDGNIRFVTGTALYTGTSAVNAVQILASTSTLASGSVYLYGIPV